MNQIKSGFEDMNRLWRLIAGNHKTQADIATNLAYASMNNDPQFRFDQLFMEQRETQKKADELQASLEKAHRAVGISIPQ